MKQPALCAQVLEQAGRLKYGTESLTQPKYFRARRQPQQNRRCPQLSDNVHYVILAR